MNWSRFLAQQVVPTRAPEAKEPIRMDLERETKAGQTSSGV